MPRSVAHAFRHEIAPIKGSRFIAVAEPVTDEAAAHSLVAQLRETYGDATHHCWAWRILRPAIDRCSDDGEPSGSAGRPILAQLTGRDLVNTAIVVVRFFGGTKLGVGGLVRAYGAAAAETLDRCTFVEASIPVRLVVQVDYGDAATVERTITDFDATIVEATYTDVVRIDAQVDEAKHDELVEALTNATAGRVQVC